ncbi:hypothetical protein [Natrarchaeobius versutus]|uniref:hypothetical protein n=1 Tax=Natrarchaeobius versutus TaxID=1679078 RepID=UPI003510A323
MVRSEPNATASDGRSNDGRTDEDVTGSRGSTGLRFVALLGAIFCLVAVTVVAAPGLAAGSDGPALDPGPDAPVPNVATTSIPADNHVVVRYEDDHVVTGSDVTAGDVPPNPNVATERGENLVVDDGEVVTEHEHERDRERIVVGNNSVRVATGDPDLVVTDGEILNDTLVVNESNGVVETLEGGSNVTTESGDVVEFSAYDESEFAITGVYPDDPVGEGENLTVDVGLENVKYGNGSRDVYLEIFDEDNDRLGEVNESVELARGESTTESFEYDTERYDHEAEELAVRVAGDDTERVPVTIQEARTVVTNLSYNQPVAGDELEVTAEIDRRGNYPRDEQEYLVGFWVDDSHVETKRVPLSPGGEATETFTYETDETDSPRVDVEVGVLEGERYAETIDVLGEATYAQNVNATIVDRNLPDEGGNLTLDAIVHYEDPDLVPSDPMDHPIELYVDGELADRTDVRLDGDEVVEEEFVYQTERGDAPRVDAELRSPGDGDTARPRVNGSGFGVAIQDVTTPVNQSDVVVVTAAIENAGDVSDDQDVRMRIDRGVGDPDRVDRRVEDTQTVSLNVSEGTTERFSYRTGDADVPEVEVAIISENDEDTTNVTVRDRKSRFDVQELAAEHAGGSDDELTLETTINNTGIEPGEQYVEFLLDGDVVHIDRLSLDPWEERTLSTDVAVPQGGTYEFAVSTANETATETASVTIDPAADDPSTDGPPDPDDDTPSETEPEDEGGAPWYLVVLGILGVLVSIVALVAYRADPEEFPPDAETVQAWGRRRVRSFRQSGAMLVAAVRSGDPAAVVAVFKRLLGLGAGTLVVQNELPRAATVRVRCQTADDTVVLEDLELGPDEQRDLGSLPDTSQFKVGAGVEDITAHEEVFQGISGDIGVVLRTDGILIANVK